MTPRSAGPRRDSAPTRRSSRADAPRPLPPSTSHRESLPPHRKAPRRKSRSPRVRQCGPTQRIRSGGSTTGPYRPHRVRARIAGREDSQQDSRCSSRWLLTQMRLTGRPPKRSATARVNRAGAPGDSHAAPPSSDPPGPLAGPYPVWRQRVPPAPPPTTRRRRSSLYSLRRLTPPARPKQLARAREPALRRPNLDTERVRDFPVGVALDIVQDEHVAIVRLERVQDVDDGDQR